MSTEATASLFRSPKESPRVYRVLRQILREIFDPSVAFDPPPPDIDAFSLEHPDGSSLVDILSDVRSRVVAHAVNSRHPHTLAHMVPPPAVVSVIADLIIGAMNQCAFIWEEAPLAAGLEKECIGWLARRLGYEHGAVGLLTSGGTMSNCLATHLALVRAKERLGGNRDRYCIIASDQAHFSLEKAAAINGLLPTSIVRVQTDMQGRLRPGAVRETADKVKHDGCIPALFVCTAGTTNSGILEPPDEFIETARTFRAWCHIDAAYGGLICLSSRPRELFKRWAEADSISWDPHKSLYVSYAVGALLLREQEALAPLQFRSEYALREGEDEPHAGTLHLDGSRRFEALKLWMTIKHFGVEGYAEVVDHTFALAKELSRLIEDTDDLILLLEPDTNIVCFRFFHPQLSDIALDAVNMAAQKSLFISGGPLVSTTRIKGRVALRAVLLNPLQESNHLAELLGLIRDEARRQASLALSVEEAGRESVACYESAS